MGVMECSMRAQRLEQEVIDLESIQEGVDKPHCTTRVDA